jgi:hypothetical protein
MLKEQQKELAEIKELLKSKALAIRDPPPLPTPNATQAGAANE